MCTSRTVAVLQSLRPTRGGRSVEDRISASTVLQLIDERGSASLVALSHELRAMATRAEVEGALKVALAERLIAADLSVPAGQVRYRVTRTGRDVLARHLDQAPTGSMRSVLEVLSEFDTFGGGSLGLVAWELGLPEDALAPAWAKAIREGLLEPAGTDKASGEAMWRLSDRGRQMHDTARDTTF
jgi:hypothetical protein